MYTIERTLYGLRLTFAGYVTAAEIQRWGQDVGRALSDLAPQFGIFVDMRTLLPLPPDAQAAMKEGQMYARTRGMQRSVVIVENAVTKLQFRRLARETGIYAWERYLDASSEANWERKGLAWVINGEDPDVEENGISHLPKRISTPTRTR